MKVPIRVLVIEDRKSDRCMARQLLGNYNLDFTWQQVSSDSELRTIAEAFNPGLVFNAAELPLASCSIALDMLSLLTLKTAVIHVAEVDDAGATLRDLAALEWQPTDPPPPPTSDRVAAGEAIDSPPRPAAPWRRSLPSLLETSADMVAMSDSAGWITYANIRASRFLSAGEPRTLSIGTVLGLAYDFASPGHAAHRLALFDALTELPIPLHLTDLVGCMLVRSRGCRTALPVVALDLHGMRLVNESGGRALSDEILNVVGSELRSGATGCGMIARVGQDDILVVIPDPSHPADAAISVRGDRRSNCALGKSEIGQSSALGAAPAPHPVDTVPAAPTLHSEDTVPAASMLHSEDAVPTALRLHSGDAVSAALVLHSQDAVPAAKPRLPVEAGLDEALQRHAIGVHYQPQFELQSGRGCGLKALARWILTSGDCVAPAIFIPVAEQAGMIDTLGASVLQSACNTAAAWRGRDAERLTVSVNVSTRQINGKFFRTLGGVLETSGLQARCLELEIAESAVLANRDLTAECLRQWKRLGVRIAVNHAGTNYSSLSYLSQLPIDRLRLDKSLIRDLTLDNGAAGVVHALISLGAELGVEVIAEGVETGPQFHMLTELGCPQVQGYLFARAMPAVQAQVALRKPWGNIPKSLLRASAGPASHEQRAS
jgi:predicted signal transduction protein with EAL and GGDEF domain